MSCQKKDIKHALRLSAMYDTDGANKDYLLDNEQKGH